MRHQPAMMTPYLCTNVICAYALSISPTNFWYSSQQPKWIIENKIKKLQKFHSNPANITAAKISALSARVLKTGMLSAMQRDYN